MQAYLREFLFWVCHYKFHPILSNISSKENDIADYLSRNHIDSYAMAFFQKIDLPCPKKLFTSDSDYTFVADW